MNNRSNPEAAQAHHILCQYDMGDIQFTDNGTVTDLGFSHISIINVANDALAEEGSSFRLTYPEDMLG